MEQPLTFDFRNDKKRFEIFCNELLEGDRPKNINIRIPRGTPIFAQSEVEFTLKKGSDGFIITCESSPVMIDGNNVAHIEKTFINSEDLLKYIKVCSDQCIFTLDNLDELNIRLVETLISRQLAGETITRQTIRRLISGGKRKSNKKRKSKKRKSKRRKSKRRKITNK